MCSVLLVFAIACALRKGDLNLSGKIVFKGCRAEGKLPKTGHSAIFLATPSKREELPRQSGRWARALPRVLVPQFYGEMESEKSERIAKTARMSKDKEPKWRRLSKSRSWQNFCLKKIGKSRAFLLEKSNNYN